MRTPEADDPLPPIKNNGLDMENYSLSQTLGDTTVQGQPLLIDGELFAAVKVSESCWTLEDHETVSILLPKCKQWEWWKSLVKGDPAIDTRRCLPGVRRLDGLGYEAERHMRKLLFDYGQKCKGLPTSEDCPEVLQKFILFEPLPSSILRVNLVIIKSPAANAPPFYPKANPSAGFPGSSPVNGPYGVQSTGFNNPRPETLRPLSTSNFQSMPTYQQPSPMYINRGPVAKNEAPPRIIPISDLNPYQGRWTIKARVTAKGELNARGEVVDQFYNQIEAGQIYLISRGSLSKTCSEGIFNHLNNEHEIFLDSTSTIQQCYEDDNRIPRQQFHFRTIKTNDFGPSASKAGFTTPNPGPDSAGVGIDGSRGIAPTTAGQARSAQHNLHPSGKLFWLLETMDFWMKGINKDTSDFSFNESGIQGCPFLKNINKPTSFSFSSLNFPMPVQGAKGPIFEDGPNFDMAFKIFHGKDGIVPLSGRPDVHCDRVKQQPTAQFNPLAARAATISLSAFSSGGPFGFGPFWDKWKNQNKKSDSSNKQEPSQKGDSANHEASGNEWLKTGNCPISKSYRAVSHVLPLVATAFQLPPGMKLICPPAVVAARAALARTALVKNLRPRPLPAKMFVIALLGMAANVPLGAWKEHTEKFSLSWFVAVHAAVPFIAMLRKSVLMPKTAMAMTIGASILGQVIGSRAERRRLKGGAETAAIAGAAAVDEYNDPSQVNPFPVAVSHCGEEGNIWRSNPVKAGRPPSSSNNVCY
ncbi:hypothetical protein V6N13_096367 [Hibiscus sabdariffa]